MGRSWKVGGYEVVIKFLGEFAAAQSWVDMMLERHLTLKAPVVGPKVLKRLRITDEDRLTYVRALAEETAYSGPMENFSRIYRRAAAVRNRIAHDGIDWPNFNAGDPADGSADYYRFTSGSINSVIQREPRESLPLKEPVQMETFFGLIEDCRWMGEHLKRMWFDAEMGKMVSPVGEVIPEMPPSLPEGGLPL